MSVVAGVQSAEEMETKLNTALQQYISHPTPQNKQYLSDLILAYKRHDWVYTRLFNELEEMKDYLGDMNVTIYQDLAEMAFMSIYGKSITSMTDEGTEDDSATWTDKTGTFADDAGTKQVGAKSLKLTSTGGESVGWFEWIAGNWTLTTPITWKDFSQLRVYFYPDTDFEMDSYLELRTASEGTIIRVSIPNTPQATWTEHTFSKSDFTILQGEVTTSTIFTILRLSCGFNGFHGTATCYVDGLDIDVQSVSPIAADTAGLLASRLYDITGTQINPAVQEQQLQQSTHWQIILGADGIIKAEESGKVVVLTDIIAANNTNNEVFYIRKKNVTGPIIFTGVFGAGWSFSHSFREGLEGDAYDGSLAGSLHLDTTTTGIQFVATGYMREA